MIDLHFDSQTALRNLNINFSFKIFFLIFIFISSTQCSSSTPSDDNNNTSSYENSIFSLDPKLLSVIDHLSGIVSIYDANSNLVTSGNLNFTEQSNGEIYTSSPSFSLDPNTSYRFVLIFYYDETPIAYVDSTQTTSSSNATNLSFDEDSVVFEKNAVVSDSLSTSISSGILPDLDTDSDGYSNYQEIKGLSDANDSASTPSGPSITNINTEFSDNLNFLTITADISDENGIDEAELFFTGMTYLESVITTSLSGTNGDSERNLTITLNPQYINTGEQSFSIVATNSLEISSSSSETIFITDNGENLAPIIVFENLSEGDIIGGTIEISVHAYDRDSVTSVNISQPSSLTNSSDSLDRFIANWDSTTTSDGETHLIATATDSKGETSQKTLNLEVSNGSDLSGPALNMTVYKPSSISQTINFRNGETVFGNVTLFVSATDPSGVNGLTLFNRATLNCSNLNNDDCALSSNPESSSTYYYSTFDSTKYEDDDEVTLQFLSTDDLGNQSITNFSLRIKNTPDINFFHANGDTNLITTSEEVTMSWSTELANSVIIKNSSGTILYEDSGDSIDSTFSFTPTETNTYTITVTYETENKNGELVEFEKSETITIQIDDDEDGYIDIIDCDDQNASTYPGAAEYCDGIDNNCDSIIDNSGAIDESIWYIDSDDDSYGSTSTTTESCEQPDGYVANSSDCNDSSSHINPNTVWYEDNDSDGYGTDSSTKTQCTQPSGYVLESTDCDDTNASLNPDTIWYEDADSDLYGNPDSTQTQCEQPTGYLSDNQDCDDTNPSINPDTVWYEDSDDDGYGNSSVNETQCEQPINYVSDSTDCDDTDEEIYPNAPERLNQKDDDCDSTKDNIYLADHDDSSLISDNTNTKIGLNIITVDINYDGHDDILIGSTEETNSDGETEAGRVYLFYGSSTQTIEDFSGGINLSDADAIFEGEDTNSESGRVFDLEDLNGDGVDDIAIGSKYLNNKGGLYIIWGSCSSAPSTYCSESHTPFSGTISLSSVYSGSDPIGMIIEGDQYGDGEQFSFAVATGDIDGDSNLDVIISDPYYDNGSDTDAGIVYLIYGSSTKWSGGGSFNGYINSIYDAAFIGENASDKLGMSLASGGDLKNNGDDDILIGTRAYGSSKGIVYFLEGSSSYSGSSLISIATSTSLLGSSTTDEFSQSLFFADINGDNYDDIIASAPAYSSNSGKLYVVLGNPSGMSSLDFSSDSADIEITGLNSGDEFAAITKNATDLNGDGFDDLLIGSWLQDVDSETYAGALYIFYGDSSFTTSSTSTPTLSDDNQFSVIYGSTSYQNLGSGMIIYDGFFGNSSYGLVFGTPFYYSTTDYPEVYFIEGTY